MDLIRNILGAVRKIETEAPSFYSITDSAISTLENNNNKCNDWSRVFFLSNAALERSSLARICHCHFYISTASDLIILGEFDANVHLQDGIVMPSGLYYSTLSGKCIVNNNCLVSNTLIVKNVYLAEQVSIVGCGKVLCDSDTRFGNCISISVGPENGGRNLTLEAGMLYSDICRFALSFPRAHQLVEAEMHCFDLYYSLTIFGANSQAFRCDVLRNLLAGPHSVLSCSSLDSCTLVSTAESPVKILNGARLLECILHEGCSALNGCTLERTYLIESASIGDNARIVHSIIGPDSTVAGGECHHSVVGPFVGFHHHSLLIATLWPLGRGNLGYGCMNGSNHTGRVNDQECWLGEGCFVGLGAAVKFPSNFIASPYSLIAAATVCPPQKLRFPFSLLLGDALGKLQVKPGWVLYASPYTLERATHKFSTRKKSRQHNTGFPIMRRSIVDMVRSSRRRLIDSLGGDGESVKAIAGAGAGFISAADVRRGIVSYTSFIQRYALYGLLYVALGPGNSCSVLPLLSAEGSAELCSGDDYLQLMQYDLSLLEHEDIALSKLPDCIFIRSDIPQVLLHQILVLEEEFSDEYAPIINALLKGADILFADLAPLVSALLSALIVLEEKQALAVQASKERDNERGKDVIDDYSSVNMSQIAALQNSSNGCYDGVVAQAYARLEALRTAIGSISAK